MTGSTPDVEYGYSTGASSSSNYVRRTSIDGGHPVNYDYGPSGGHLNDYLSRIQKIAPRWRFGLVIEELKSCLAGASGWFSIHINILGEHGRDARATASDNSVNTPGADAWRLAWMRSILKPSAS